jgi:hypothetical protein
VRASLLLDSAIERGRDDGWLCRMPRHVSDDVFVMLQLAHYLTAHHICNTPSATPHTFYPAETISAQHSVLGTSYSVHKIPDSVVGTRYNVLGTRRSLFGRRFRISTAKSDIHFPVCVRQHRVRQTETAASVPVDQSYRLSMP